MAETVIDGLIHLFGRDECETELGFSYATASDVPFEQLQRAAQELYRLRRFRAAYEALQREFSLLPAPPTKDPTNG